MKIFVTEYTNPSDSSITPVGYQLSEPMEVGETREDLEADLLEVSSEAYRLLVLDWFDKGHTSPLYVGNGPKFIDKWEVI